MDLPADAPKTDRELLLQINQNVDNLRQKLEGQDGNGGLCKIVMVQEIRLTELEKWRIYQTGILILLIALITGRYIFGPTSIPIVP